MLSRTAVATLVLDFNKWTLLHTLPIREGRECLTHRGGVRGRALGIPGAGWGVRSLPERTGGSRREELLVAPPPPALPSLGSGTTADVI